MELKYKVGDRIKAVLVVTDIDPTEGNDGYPYTVKVAGGGTHTDLRGWVSTEELDSIAAEADPNVRKQQILQQIKELNKQLAEIEE